MKPKTAIKRFLCRRRGYIFYHGIKVPTDSAAMNTTVLDALWKGVYELPELRALQRLVKSGDRLLEMGCGLGVVSGAIAKVHSDVNIESFEANRTLMPAINALHQTNGLTNITVRNAVLGHVTSPQTRKFAVGNSFAEGALVVAGSDVQTLDVDVVDLNEHIRNFKPTAILCDIEGGEVELFSRIDLSGIRAVVLELHPARVAPYDNGQIFQTCIDAGLAPRVDLFGDQVVAFERPD